VSLGRDALGPAFSVLLVYCIRGSWVSEFERSSQRFLSLVVPGDADRIRSGIYPVTELRYLGYGKLRL
jgi:hypothetical protein